MTAPLGALAMSLLGPVLLKKASGTDSQPPETEHKEEAKLEDMAEVGNHTPSINSKSGNCLIGYCVGRMF